MGNYWVDQKWDRLYAALADDIVIFHNSWSSSGDEADINTIMNTNRQQQRELVIEYAAMCLSPFECHRIEQEYFLTEVQKYDSQSLDEDQ